MLHPYIEKRLIRSGVSDIFDPNSPPGPTSVPHQPYTHKLYCSCVRSSHTALTVSQETMCNRSFLPCVCSIEFAQLRTWHHLYNYVAPFYQGSVRMNFMSPVAMKWKVFESNTTTVILDFLLGLLCEIVTASTLRDTVT